MKSLEDVTAEDFWAFYLRSYPPPPDIPSVEIQGAKNFYMSGLAAMLALARFMESETPERRNAVYGKLYIELNNSGIPVGPLN
jgi:hypothetical protein